MTRHDGEITNVRDDAAATTRIGDLPLGWKPTRCRVKPGIHHDSFRITGAEREVVLAGGDTLIEVVHECRKCGVRCRWVKMPWEYAEDEASG